MGRKNSPSAKKELTEIIQRYEAAKAEKRQLYLDGDQLADIADWYATERKFNDAQEVINYGLQLHPGNTGLLIEQAFLYLDTQKLSKAKEVANSITETYDSEVKMLKAELLLNEGKLEEAQQLIIQSRTPTIWPQSSRSFIFIWIWDIRKPRKNG